MKIYRIAMPLPLDEIPIEEGAVQVDQVLDYYTLQELNEKYNFQEYLGGGQFGVAYLAGDGRVVKLTTDEQEYILAQELIGDNWQKHAPFAKVHSAEELAPNLYIIIKEKVRPLNEEEQNLFSQFTDEFEGSVDYVTEEYIQHMPLFEKFEEYVMDVSNYMFADVFNVGNIGWDENDNLVSFDPRKAYA